MVICEKTQLYLTDKGWLITVMITFLSPQTRLGRAVTSVWIIIGLLFVAVITGTVTNSVSTNDFGIDASSTVAAVEGSYEWDVASNNYRAKMVPGLRNYKDVVACMKNPNSFGDRCRKITHAVMSTNVAAIYQDTLLDGGEPLAIGDFCFM